MSMKCEWCGDYTDSDDCVTWRFYSEGLKKWTVAKFCSNRCREAYKDKYPHLVEYTEEREEYEKTPEYKEIKAKRARKLEQEAREAKERERQKKQKNFIGNIIGLLLHLLTIIIITPACWFAVWQFSNSPLSAILARLFLAIFEICYIVNMIKEGVPGWLEDERNFFLKWWIILAVASIIYWGVNFFIL